MRSKTLELVIDKKSLTDEELENIFNLIRYSDLRSIVIGGVTSEGDLVSFGRTESTLDQFGIVQHLMLSNTIKSIGDYELEDE